MKFSVDTSDLDRVIDRLQDLQETLRSHAPDEEDLVDSVHGHLAEQMAVGGMDEGGATGVWPKNGGEYAEMKQKLRGHTKPMFLFGELAKNAIQSTFRRETKGRLISYIFQWTRPGRDDLFYRAFGGVSPGQDVAQWYQNDDPDENRRFVLTKGFLSNILDRQYRAMERMLDRVFQ